MQLNVLRRFQFAVAFFLPDYVQYLLPGVVVVVVGAMAQQEGNSSLTAIKYHIQILKQDDEKAYRA